MRNRTSLPTRRRSRARKAVSKPVARDGAAPPAPASSREVWFAETQGDLARFFGVSTATIGDWRKDGAPAKVGQGWDLVAWTAWRIERVRKHAERNAGAMSDPDYAYKCARARLAELRLEHEKGTLMAVAEHDEAMTRLC